MAPLTPVVFAASIALSIVASGTGEAQVPVSAGPAAPTAAAVAETQAYNRSRKDEDSMRDFITAYLAIRGYRPKQDWLDSYAPTHVGNRPFLQRSAGRARGR